MAQQAVRIAGYQGAASILTRSLRDLAQQLAATGMADRVQVEDDVTAAGETAASLFASIDGGARQIGYMASGYLAARVPSLGVLDLPFSVQDRQAALAALDGEAGALLSADVAHRTGYEVLGFWDNGFRHITNGVRPIRCAADCAGLRIRTLDSALYRAVLAALGFEPRTTDVKDLVRVVREREVDAQENPLTNFVHFGLWRHHPHVSLTGHFFGLLLLVCHRPWLHSLAPAEQEQVRAAARQATVLQRARAAEEDAASLQMLAGQDAVQVLQPGDIDLASMRNASADIAARQRALLDPALVHAYLDRLR